MNAPSLSELFVRWRAQGDMRALSDVFNQTAPALERLARRLTGNAHDADDAVQATFLAALDDADRFDPERPLAPWLVGILVRRVKAERRRKSASLDAERLARLDESDPLQAALDGELETAVEHALRELPECYSEVLRPKLVDGSRSVEIASRLGRSPGVVRTQIRRALVLLRQALPAGLSAGAGVFVFSTPGLAQIKRSVLMHGARDGRFWLKIGLLMNTKLLVGSSLLAVAVACWLAFGPDGQTAEPLRNTSLDVAVVTPNLEVPEDVSTLAPVASPGRETSEAAALDANPQEARDNSPVQVSKTQDSPVESWFISGRVLGPAGIDHDASALRGTKVRISGPGVAMEFGVVKSDGSFRQRMRARKPWRVVLPETEPSNRIVRVVATHPRYMPGSVEIDASSRTSSDGYNVELVLVEAAHVRGKIAPPRGFPRIADVALYRSERGAPVGEPLSRSKTDRNGVFALKTAHGGPAVLVASLRGLRPATRTLETFLGVDIDLPSIPLERGYRLSGQVSPVPIDSKQLEVRVRLEGQATESTSERLVWLGESFEWTGASAVLGEQGVFTIDGLAPTRYDVDAADRVPVVVDLQETGFVELVSVKSDQP